jgi:hypothetical protein
VVKNSWLPGLISHLTSYKGVAYLGQGGIYIYKRYTCVFHSQGWRRKSRGNPTTTNMLVVVTGTFGMNVGIERLGWVQTKESTLRHGLVYQIETLTRDVKKVVKTCGGLRKGF